jgi:serine/threonine protein kinase
MGDHGIRDWRPNGIRYIIDGGASNFIAIYDDTTVLKFPRVPPRESSAYPLTASGLSRLSAIRGLALELQILERLGQHPRVVQLKGEHKDGLLLEYLPNRSVEHYLSTHVYVAPEQRLIWGQQAADGLDYIHGRNVIHGDVSIGNILVGPDLGVKFCDIQGILLPLDDTDALDSGVPQRDKSSTLCSDPNYMDRMDDIHSLGTALYFIITGEMPFPDLEADEEEEIDARFQKNEFPPLERVLAGDVIRKCWLRMYNVAAEMRRDLEAYTC